MTQQRILTIVQVAAAATSVTPIDLDYRWEGIQNRSVSGSVTSGDTITIMVSPVPSQSTAKQSIIGNTTWSAQNDFWVTVSSYTTKFADLIEGPWARMQILKSGSTGTATVFLLG